jgi:lysophospholipase L1-like esterase
MRRRQFLQTVGLAALAAPGAAYWNGRRSRFSGGCYLQLGTSVTSGVGSGVGTERGGMTPAIVGDILGMQAINGACPGSCAGKHKFPEHDPVSLYSLSDAITSGNWSSQKKTGEPIRDGAISRLMNAGFESVTVVGLEYGTNDFRYDRPIGSDDDAGKETFTGALNHSIKTLQHSFPNFRIFLITPWWMPTFDDQDSDEHPNGVGIFLKDYVGTMRRIAELNRIPCLDLWSNSGIGKGNYKYYTLDGVHPNEAGVSRRAELIWSFIAGNV